MITFTLLTATLALKLETIKLTRNMVNLDISKRLGLNLYQAGRRLILSSIHNGQLLDASSQEAQTASTEYLLHNWLEALFVWTQMVILWHDPLVSICAISGALSMFL